MNTRGRQIVISPVLHGIIEHTPLLVLPSLGPRVSLHPQGVAEPQGVAAPQGVASLHPRVSLACTPGCRCIPGCQAPLRLGLNSVNNGRCLNTGAV